MHQSRPKATLPNANSDRVAPATSDPHAASPWRNLSEADWRQRLSPRVYAVLREGHTEPPRSSPLLNEHRAGTFVCAGCELPLFKSTWKFESGSGWPSFFAVLPGAIATRIDSRMDEVRTEYHCARCGGHQGHVFQDGPQPSGVRHCNDGLALKFIPE